jgi:hypothetical protein
MISGVRTHTLSFARKTLVLSFVKKMVRSYKKHNNIKEFYFYIYSEELDGREVSALSVRSQKLSIVRRVRRWVTKNDYLELLRASDVKLQFQGGWTSGRRPVKIIVRVGKRFITPILVAILVISVLSCLQFKICFLWE